MTTGERQEKRGHGQWPLVLGIIALLIGGAALLVKFGPEQSGVAIGQKAPDFRLVNVATGDSVSLREMAKDQVTLVNIWATWCIPCKEEMPRLIAWQEKLRKAGVLIDLAFVSLDDDERQLERFLDGQPPAGVRASYWLPEGAPRATFLSSLDFKDTPELPLQALVSPSGQLACAIQGAVEDRDYDAIAAFVGAKK